MVLFMVPFCDTVYIILNYSYIQILCAVLSGR